MAADVQAVLVAKAWLYRCVRLTGKVEAEVVFSSRGWNETVKVNGELGFRRRSCGPTFAQKLPFTISVDGGTFDAKIFVPRVPSRPSFQIFVDGELVYSEKHQVYSVPRKYDLATLFAVTTAYAV